MSYNVAILGYGTVGSSVYKYIKDLKNINVSYILVKNLDKKRDGVNENLLTNDYNKILNDKNVDIIIEVMGGIENTYTILKEAILLKKHVITANKALLGSHLEELYQLSKENKVAFLFEASVGGAMKCIHSLILESSFNEIFGIKGILNGSTNYILSLTEKGVFFDEALLSAKNLGFLEADPTDDLEGIDSRRKLSILESIAYKKNVNSILVPTISFLSLNNDILNDFNSSNFKIKYVAISKKINHKIYHGVLPSLTNQIYKDIVFENNYVEFENLMSTKLSFIGPGAGGSPTASSILFNLNQILLNSYNYDLNFDNLDEITNDLYGDFIVKTSIKKENMIPLFKDYYIINDYLSNLKADKNIKFIAYKDF